MILLGYPLHPPGKPQQRRDAHLPAIREPILFVQGSRDPFGTAREIRDLLPALQRAELYAVEGGDHSFKVPSSARSPAGDVIGPILDRVAGWIRSTDPS